MSMAYALYILILFATPPGGILLNRRIVVQGVATFWQRLLTCMIIALWGQYYTVQTVDAVLPQRELKECANFTPMPEANDQYSANHS
jgi:hypothetical protein